MSYLSFVAPGMSADAAFMTPFFQALFSALIRMHYQRTWEGQLTGLVSFDLLRLPLVVPLAFVAGCGFASIALLSPRSFRRSTT